MLPHRLPTQNLHFSAQHIASAASHRLRTFIGSLLLCVLTLLLTACSEPLPDARKNYIGEWHSDEMTIIIRSGGEVEYERLDGNKTTKIKGPFMVCRCIHPPPRKKSLMMTPLA